MEKGGAPTPAAPWNCPPLGEQEWAQWSLGQSWEASHHLLLCPLTQHCPSLQTGDKGWRSDTPTHPALSHLWVRDEGK